MKCIKSISVHCWGGLGSQLFTWAMAEYLNEKFPRKHIKIVFHSGGVTKRSPAIDFLASKFEIKIQDDYSSIYNLNGKKISRKPTYIKILKYILKSTCFVLEANSTVERDKIKPWTMVLRGHYSYNQISDQVLNNILNEIYSYKGIKLSSKAKHKSTLGVHYRLGDLLELPNKTYVKPYILSEVIIKIMQLNELNQIIVYSENSNLTRKILENLIPDSSSYKESEIWDTLLDLLQVEYFIGTNSKISIWITAFRVLMDINSNNALPISMKENIEAVFPRIEFPKNITYYE